MSKATMTRVSVDLPAELAEAIAGAAKANNVTAEDIVSDCVQQQCETALRHRVLVQRQNDVDEALLDLARLVGRLSAVQASRAKIFAAIGPEARSDGNIACARLRSLGRSILYRRSQS
jgi:hypothetical protein